MAMAMDPESCEAQWQEFLVRNHLVELWKMEHGTEQERYGEIVQHLEAEEKRRHELEQKIVQERERWAIMSRYFSTKRRRRLQRDLNTLFSTAHQVELSWANRVNREADFNRALHECAQPGHSVFKRFMIRLGDFGDEDAREIAVHNTLDLSRYYFGSPGGRYIFRHENAEPSHFDEACYYTAAWDSLLENNHDELPATYTFCGLVPRTLKEYTARFRIVCAKVEQLLHSIVAFTGNTRDELATFPDKADSLTRTQLADLHKAWERLVLSDDATLRWAREKTRAHTLILECAHLVSRIGNHVDAFMDQIKPLADTLQLATGRHGGRLIDGYDELLADEALQMLLQKRQVEQCVLINSNIEENIHDFFKDPRFIVDPLHPLNRFTRLDVQSALDQVDRLSQLDKGDEAASSSSDSELSDPPHSIAELSEGPDPDGDLWTLPSPNHSNPPPRDSTSSSAGHSLPGSPHPRDPAYPELWDPRSPGHVGPRRIDDADVPIEVDGRDAEADEDEEENEAHHIGTNSTSHELRQNRRQLPPRSPKRKRRLSSASLTPSRGD
ncbi:hypothetical protein E4U53_002428 [Claviceps sorghi]|nr:hypothetical protein E4U53_002428 [Claviceps sorghi]